MTHTQLDPAWPAQVRLHGQTAAHPGPVDMTMMYLMHHALRRDLAAFAAAATATPVTDRQAWAALAARWELFSTALHHHHSGEDAHVWPLLTERTDDAGRAVLAELDDAEFGAELLEGRCRAAAVEAGMKAGDFFSPMRVAVTGRTVSPPLFASLELIGRERSLARIDNALSKLAEAAS